MPDPYRFAQCEVRPAERQLLVDGAVAALGGRAFDLLVTLIERRDRVVGKSELFEAVWPGVVEENNLQVQVSSLRKLLGPGAIMTVAGRGYQFVAPLEVSRDGDTKALPPATPNNLPHARSRFIGREAALADCTALLDGTRLLTLSGIGGCGKTRLAQELAQRALPKFPDGVWFVHLAPLQEAQRVSATVADTLGVQVGQLSDHLKARRALVVMDNCEHVIGAATRSIETLLERCGSLKIIATSREVLGTTGEQVLLSRGSDDRRGLAAVLTNLASVFMSTGRLDAARATLAEARSHANLAGYKGLVECGTDVAAALASSLGEHALAARFNGAAKRQLHEAHIFHDPVDEATIAPRIAASRAALGDAAFEAAKADGWALSYERTMAELDRWLCEPLGPPR
jgi:DNA-binding winged helix-turn-helix (wHTH) protein